MVTEDVAGEWRTGDLTVTLDSEQLTVTEGDRVVWQSPAGAAFLTAARGSFEMEEHRGYFWPQVHHERELDRAAGRSGRPVRCRDPAGRHPQRRGSGPELARDHLAAARRRRAAGRRGQAGRCGDADVRAQRGRRGPRLRGAVRRLRPRRPAAAAPGPRAGSRPGHATADAARRPHQPLRGRRRHDDVRRDGVVRDRRRARRGAGSRRARLPRLRRRRHPGGRGGRAGGVVVDPDGRAHRGRDPGGADDLALGRHADRAGVEPERRDHRPAGRHDRGPSRARPAAGGRRRDLRRLAAGLVGPAHDRRRRAHVVDLAARPAALPRLGAAGRGPRPAGHRGHDLREPVPRRRGPQGGRHDPEPLRRGARGTGTSSRGRAARRTSSTRVGSTRRWSTSATPRRATGTPT